MAMNQDSSLISKQTDLTTNGNDSTPLSPASGDLTEIKLSYYLLEKRQLLLQWETNSGLAKNISFELIQVGKDNQNSIVYAGDKFEYLLQYKITSLGKQHCYKVIFKGDLLSTESNLVSVGIPAEVPSQPSAPKLQISSKTTTFIRWNAVENNGAPIKAYHLEHLSQDRGDYELVYSGNERNIRLPFKLEAAMSYKFRLRAENSVGISQYSPILNYSTSPGKPTAPSPPYLKSHTSNSITVGWDEVASQQEETIYILAMEDPLSGHGFLIIHHDKESECKKEGLNRISNYNFRLAVNNQYGTSPYSSVVTFTTAPDTPQQPHTLALQSKPEYRCLNVTWSPPKDDGGDPVKTYSVEIAPLGRQYKRPYCLVCEENEVRIQELKPGREYQIRVAAENSAGLSQYCNPVIFRTKIQKPEAPRLEGVEVKSGDDTIRLEWGYPPFDGGSKITCYQLDMLRELEWVTVYEDRYRNFLFKNLEPTTSYTFRVRCQNEAGYGQFTNNFEARTVTGPPPAPSPPELTSTQSQSINVSWMPPYLRGAPVKGALEYNLQMQTVGSSSKWRSVYLGTNLTCQVKQNIIPSMTYQFRISAKSEIGSSEWSRLAIISTPSGPPGVVQNVKASKVKPTSALLEWTPIQMDEFPILSYLILLNHNKHLEVPHPHSSHNIVSLQPQTNYELQVQAKNQIGTGPLSQVASFRTPTPPPSPPTLEIGIPTSSSVVAKWSPNSVQSERYVLQMRPVELSIGEFQTVYAGSERKFKLIRLKPRTGYVLRISAANTSGEGSFSEDNTFYTLPQSPPMPRELRAEWANDKLLISWKPHNSDAYTYLLQFREVGKEFRAIHEGKVCRCILNCQMNTFDIRIVTKLVFTNKLDTNWPDFIESSPSEVLTVVKPKQEQAKSVKKSEIYYEKRIRTTKEPIVEEMETIKPTTGYLPTWITNAVNNPYLWIGLMVIFTLALSFAVPYFVHFN